VKQHTRRGLVLCPAFRIAKVVAIALLLHGQTSSIARATSLHAPAVVLFATDSTEIDPVTFGEIQRLLADSHTKQKARFLVQCYADSVGSDRYNFALSERRCKTVRDALVDGGIASNRIETLAHGEHELNVPTGDNVAEQANRKAVITWTWD